MTESTEKQDADTGATDTPNTTTTYKTVGEHLVLFDELVFGLTMGEGQNKRTHKTFELRQQLTADIFAAEQNAHVQNVLTFDAALLCEQLLCIGDFKGPFSLDIIAGLDPTDFQILRDAMFKLEKKRLRGLSESANSSSPASA